MTLASISMSGPPELPGFVGASICTASSTEVPGGEVAAALVVSKAAFGKAPPANQGDPVIQVGQAANLRMALPGGAAYLRDTLTAKPVTPADLAKAVNSMGQTLGQIGISQVTSRGLQRPHP